MFFYIDQLNPLYNLSSSFFSKSPVHSLSFFFPQPSSHGQLLSSWHVRSAHPVGPVLSNVGPSNPPAHPSLYRCQSGRTYRPFSLVFHPSRTVLVLVRRNRPSLACAPALCRQLTSSRAPHFASEPRTEARHPPDPRVCTSRATYLAMHASLGSAHLFAALVPALALELLATPRVATPGVSLPQYFVVHSFLFFPCPQRHAALLGRSRALLVLACCPPHLLDL
jgi:hypothetical protein